MSIIGPSGCGKSTLLRAFSDLVEPSIGEISVNGKMPAEARAAREFGVVFQSPNLLPWRTVLRNVTLPLQVMGVDRPTRNQTAHEMLELVGLGSFARHHPWQLSGGMQQRVALARCLANDPEVILMDEPLGALDALTREKMQSLILKLWQETGKTIVLVTHSVEEALYLGDRLFVMAPRPGRIERQYELPFAANGLHVDPREMKASTEFIEKREELLSLIWEMEEQIMGPEGGIA